MEEISPRTRLPSLTASSSAAEAASSSTTTGASSTPPSVAVARRSRQEVRTAQKGARADRASPRAWARCLLSHAVGLWFVHAPAFAAFAAGSDTRAAVNNVRFAYDVMTALLESEEVQIEEVRDGDGDEFGNFSYKDDSDRTNICIV